MSYVTLYHVRQSDYKKCFENVKKKSNFNANILNNSFLFFIFAIFYCQNVKNIKIQGKNQLVLIYYNKLLYFIVKMSKISRQKSTRSYLFYLQSLNYICRIFLPMPIMTHLKII